MATKKTPLQRLNDRIRKAKKAYKEGKKGASGELDKAINAKAEYKAKKAAAACRNLKSRTRKKVTKA